MKSIHFNDISLTPLCKVHLDALAPRLRPADRAEMWAAYRLPPREVLELCMRRSAFALALVSSKEVLAAAGVEPSCALGLRACVWSWTGQGVRGHVKSFLRASRAALEIWQARYPLLYAACDERYKQARHYLLYLGAREGKERFYLAGRETRFVPYSFNALYGRNFTDKGE